MGGLKGEMLPSPWKEILMKDGYKDVLDTITIDANDQPTTKAIVMEMN